MVLKIFKKIKGFSLIELLVSLGVFLVLFQGTLGILIYSIRLQQRLLAEQEIADGLGYAIEYMGRALRMALKEDGSYSCLPDGYAYDYVGGSSRIRFINHLESDECHDYFVENGALVVRKGGTVLELTPPAPLMEIQNLSFALRGHSGGGPFQPQATISFQAVSNSIPFSIPIQTTVSQRNLDIPSGSSLPGFNSGYISIGLALVDPGISYYCGGFGQCVGDGWLANSGTIPQVCQNETRLYNNNPSLPLGMQEDFVCTVVAEGDYDGEFFFEKSYGFVIGPGIGVNLPPGENDFYISFYALYDSGGLQTGENVEVIINGQSQTSVDLWDGEGGIWRACTFPNKFTIEEGDEIYFAPGPGLGSIYLNWWQISSNHPGYQDCTI